VEQHAKQAAPTGDFPDSLALLLRDPARHEALDAPTWSEHAERGVPSADLFDSHVDDVL
jgi:hypothetical protein